MNQNKETAIVQGEFCTFRHIKTRKAFVIEVEFPEEAGQEVLRVLGMPIGGESKPVAVCLLDTSNIPQAPVSSISDYTTEGDKLRIRAVMLAKDEQFQSYGKKVLEARGSVFDYGFSEDDARWFICAACNIKSRSELATNIEAQKKFKELDRQYKEWLNPIDEQYKDSLERL